MKSLAAVDFPGCPNNIDWGMWDFETDNEYIRQNMRMMRRFQYGLVNTSMFLWLMLKFTEENLVIHDLGDADGFHQWVAKEEAFKIAEEWKTVSLKHVKTCGYNISQKAVDKIQANGYNAVVRSIENYLNIDNRTWPVDIVMMFETLEHLENPVHVLRSLNSKMLILTVPYIRQSRVGFHQARRGRAEEATPENLHIFELSPQDWKLIFEYTGWRVIHEDLYYQYPRTYPHAIWGFLMKYLWRYLDYEGFWGVTLFKKIGKI